MRGLGPHSGSELGADLNPWTPAAYAESMAGADDESKAESEAEAEVEEGAGVESRPRGTGVGSRGALQQSSIFLRVSKEVPLEFTGFGAQYVRKCCPFHP